MNFLFLCNVVMKMQHKSVSLGLKLHKLCKCILFLISPLYLSFIVFFNSHYECIVELTECVRKVWWIWCHPWTCLNVCECHLFIATKLEIFQLCVYFFSRARQHEQFFIYWGTQGLYCAVLVYCLRLNTLCFAILWWMNRTALPQ